MKLPIIICATVQILGWLILTLISRGIWTDGFAYETDNDLTPTWTFFGIQAGMAATVIATWRLVNRKRDRSDSGSSFAIIIGVSLLIRLIALPGEPIHESDFYRYIWDGKVSAAQVNPYRFEPAALLIQENQIDFEFEDETSGATWRGRNFTDDETKLLAKLDQLRKVNPTVFERVSHPAVTTIYPPVAQWVFYINEKLSGGSVIGIKLLFVFFDMGVIAFLLLILRHLKLPVYLALIYAWNPLPVKEFANSGHYDSVAIFFMVAALYLAVRPGHIWIKTVSVVTALAFGTLAKYFAILLLPVLLIYLHQQKNQLQQSRLISSFTSPVMLTGGTLFLLYIAIGFLPYIEWNEAGITEVFRGLATYQKHWQYSPGGFAILTSLIENSLAKKLAAAILFFTVISIALFSKRSASWKCFAAIASLFFLSPTAFPWYFCWVLAFTPFQKRISWLVLALLLPINYIDFHTEGSYPLANVVWHGFYATQLISWGSFAIFWIAESIYLLRSNR